jgi:Glycoside-hydrolase family GH114
VRTPRLVTAVLTAVPLVVAIPATVAGSTAAAAQSTAPQSTAAAAAPQIPPPVHRGTLRITGQPRDGALVTASGLAWHAPRLPRGMKLLSFEVAYTWQSCAPSGRRCTTAADSTATPFAARQYRAGHADTGRRLRVTETAAEVVQTRGRNFNFKVLRRSVSRLAGVPVRAYRRQQRPVSYFRNGTPEQHTASAEEYFQVAAPHYNTADGKPSQQYRVDQGAWRPMPANHVFYTGKLAVGPHQVSVRTANRAGSTQLRFGWRVVPLPAPLACQPRAGQPCWYPPHLAANHRPMRWDWQIGRTTPLKRTGKRAVDMYDIDGFLTTRAEVAAIQTRWPASTLAHPKTICYLDLAWEDYRPDASPPARGGLFPSATLGNVYFGYPEERWVDFRQLDALKPMLRERIGMCARKGFSAVELDDIDSFDPPSTTGFRLTPGDAQNYLAYAFNLIHADGMTGLWKNSPYLSWWGRQYSDGALLEECYTYHQCTAAQLRGSSQYGITCTGLSGATPCGWDDFSTDKTAAQPNGKWVGDAEYGDDHFVCNPGQTGPKCTGQHAYAAFCRTLYDPPLGFAAVKFDVDLDGRVFYPCPSGS